MEPIYKLAAEHCRGIAPLLDTPIALQVWLPTPKEVNAAVFFLRSHLATGDTQGQPLDDVLDMHHWRSKWRKERLLRVVLIAAGVARAKFPNEIPGESRLLQLFCRLHDSPEWREDLLDPALLEADHG